MDRLDKKTQMMDAGMILFSNAEPYGTTIGRIKEIMEKYGRVFKANELDYSLLPSSTGECDLFMNFSTPWRTRYISCKCEVSGDKYAASFKEGNRSGILRSITFILLAILLLTLGIICHLGIWGVILGIVSAAIALYLWIIPSKKSRIILSEIMNRLK